MAILDTLVEIALQWLREVAVGVLGHRTEEFVRGYIRRKREKPMAAGKTPKSGGRRRVGLGLPRVRTRGRHDRVA
jgi:hypothetical protein